MSHRAALYTVQVHRTGHPNDLRLLGDFDDEGLSLLDALKNYVPDVDITLQVKKLRYLSSKAEGDELLVMFEHGQGGVDATIRNSEGETQYHQVPEDSQDIECGCLVRLPCNGRVSWLAIHVPDHRGQGCS